MNAVSAPKHLEVIGMHYPDDSGIPLPIVYIDPALKSRASRDCVSRYRGPEKTAAELDEECDRVHTENTQVRER